MKISIITPTLNDLIKLKENIVSIYGQNYKDIEHIIVDSLSDDGTKEFIEEYQKKADYPVIYICEKDKGTYDAMNKGIRASSGEWVHILNTDDRYVSNKSLEFLMNQDITDYDIIANSILVWHEEINSYSKWIPESKSRIDHYNFPHTGMVIKKKFYESYGLYNENYKIISDAIFCMENIPKAKYKIIKEPLVIMAGSGVSNKLSYLRMREGLIFIWVYYKGSFFEKIKYTFIDTIRDFKILLRIIKNKFKK
jgi:glycosyltransferase